MNGRDLKATTSLQEYYQTLKEKERKEVEKKGLKIRQFNINEKLALFAEIKSYAEDKQLTQSFKISRKDNSFFGKDKIKKIFGKQPASLLVDINTIMSTGEEEIIGEAEITDKTIVNQVYIYLHPEIDEYDFSLSDGHEIGSGAFGKVKFIQNLSGDVFVLKTPKNVNAININFKNLNDEFTLAKQESMGYLHISDESKKKDYMVLQYIYGQTLDKLLSERGDQLSFYEKKELINEFVSAYHFLHGKEIAHRDLHTGNVIVGDKSMRIIDLGNATGREGSIPATLNDSRTPIISRKLLTSNDRNEIYSISNNMDRYQLLICLFEIHTNNAIKEPLRQFKNIIKNLSPELARNQIDVIINDAISKLTTIKTETEINPVSIEEESYNAVESNSVVEDNNNNEISSDNYGYIAQVQLNGDIVKINSGKLEDSTDHEAEINTENSKESGDYIGNQSVENKLNKNEISSGEYTKDLINQETPVNENKAEEKTNRQQKQQDMFAIKEEFLLKLMIAIHNQKYADKIEYDSSGKDLEDIFSKNINKLFVMLVKKYEFSLAAKDNGSGLTYAESATGARTPTKVVLSLNGTLNHSPISAPISPVGLFSTQSNQNNNSLFNKSSIPISSPEKANNQYTPLTVITPSQIRETKSEEESSRKRLTPKVLFFHKDNGDSNNHGSESLGMEKSNLKTL